LLSCIGGCIGFDPNKEFDVVLPDYEDSNKLLSCIGGCIGFDPNKEFDVVWPSNAGALGTGTNKLLSYIGGYIGFDPNRPSIAELIGLSANWV